MSSVAAQSASVLALIAALIFHTIVTLPLADMTAKQYVLPLARARQDTDGVAYPDWVFTVAVFLLMAIAFWLRSHGTSAVLVANALSSGAK